MNLQRKSIISILIQRQSRRYKKKGLLNIIIASSLLALIIIGGTQFGKYIWPAQILDPEWFTFKTSLFLHFSCQILYFLTFLPGYMGLTFYKGYEISPELIKPWNRPNWHWQLLRTIFYLLLNKGVLFPLSLYTSMNLSGIKTRITQFPDALEIFTQLMIVMYIQDFFFYWYHKLSHQIRFLYKFHKIHHQYQSLYSLVAEYTHPIDYLFGVLIPSSLPFVVLGLRAHCFMLFFWQVWKIYVSSQGHSGYQFPWSPTRILPFVSGPSYHDFHHSQNVGNYSGSVYLWDTIYRENDLYFNQFFKQIENGKRQ